MPSRLNAAPRWLRLSVGVCLVLLGAVLTLKPFDSLDALVLYVGVALIVAGGADLVARRDRLAGGALIVGGVLVLALPGLAVGSVALVVGVGMAVSGALRLVRGVRRETGERFVAIATGLALSLLGLLALAWPDATILTVAFLVGPAAVLLGIATVAGALRHHDESGKQEGHGRRHPRLRAIGALAAALAALGLVGLSALVHSESAELGSFYEYSGKLPVRPGVLLRSEPVRQSLPDGARGWRVLYTTTGSDGRVETASGLVVAPRGDARRLPTILWNHGTTGAERRCAPSALADGFKAGAMFLLPDVVREGWALVAPDYPGLGAPGRHPYLVGAPAGRSGLDAVRAARRIPELRLGPDVVAWGHSQGGGAALWTGEVDRRYAPDVPLRGVAALAPASDLVGLANGLQGSPVGTLFASLLVQGYSDAYPDVEFDQYVRPAARTVMRRVAARCLSDPAVLLSLPAVLPGERIYSRPLTGGPLGRRLRENVPGRPTGIPTLVAQGLDDTLVLPAVQRRFVARLCAAGQPVELVLVAGRDHVALVSADSPLVDPLLRWTAARLAGTPTPAGCRTVRLAGSEVFKWGSP